MRPTKSEKKGRAMATKQTMATYRERNTRRKVQRRVVARREPLRCRIVRSTAANTGCENTWYAGIMWMRTIRLAARATFVVASVVGQNELELDQKSITYGLAYSAVSPYARYPRMDTKN
jgi:hypothetical protein